jgi:hypothetical protein
MGPGLRRFYLPQFHLPRGLKNYFFFFPAPPPPPPRLSNEELEDLVAQLTQKEQ